MDSHRYFHCTATGQASKEVFLNQSNIETYTDITQTTINLERAQYFIESRKVISIYEQRQRVFLSIVFECLVSVWKPGETRARVVYMASQMNGDVMGCFVC